MESPFYSYLYIKTQCLDDNWETLKIEKFLKLYQQSIALINESNGHFRSNAPFLSMQLMCVKSYDSWSSLDYHPSNTNFIAIITNKSISLEAQQLLYQLSLFLNADTIEEKDDGDAIFISARSES